MGWLLNQILEWLLAAILAAFDAIVAAIAHGLLITPDVTGLPQVQALTGNPPPSSTPRSSSRSSPPAL